MNMLITYWHYWLSFLSQLSKYSLVFTSCDSWLSFTIKRTAETLSHNGSYASGQNECNDSSSTDQVPVNNIQPQSGMGLTLEQIHHLVHLLMKDLQCNLACGKFSRARKDEDPVAQESQWFWNVFSIYSEHRVQSCSLYSEINALHLTWGTDGEVDIPNSETAEQGAVCWGNLAWLFKEAQIPVTRPFLITFMWLLLMSFFL